MYLENKQRGFGKVKLLEKHPKLMANEKINNSSTNFKSHSLDVLLYTCNTFFSPY